MKLHRVRLSVRRKTCPSPSEGEESSMRSLSPRSWENTSRCRYERLAIDRVIEMLEARADS